MIKGEKRNNSISFVTTDDAKKIETLPLNKILQDSFKNTFKNVFDLSIDDKTSLLKQKMKEGTEPLDQFFNISFGLKTGDDDKYLTFDPSISPLCKRLVRGADINRWIINFKGEYVIYDTMGMRKNKKTARPGSKERFEQPKVLVRDTGSGLMATFDNENYYVKDVLILEDINRNVPQLKMLSALLNSKAMRWFYESTFPTLHVQRDELASLPIPTSIFTSFYLNKVSIIVDKIINDKKEGKDTSYEENEIDQFFYQFYKFSEDEIKIMDRIL